MFVECFRPTPIASALQLIAANLPPEIGRQLTNVCTVRFGTKELSSMFFELWFVVPGCLFSTEASLLQSAVALWTTVLKSTIHWAGRKSGMAE